MSPRVGQGCNIVTHMCNNTDVTRLMPDPLPTHPFRKCVSSPEGDVVGSLHTKVAWSVFLRSPLLQNLKHLSKRCIFAFVDNFVQKWRILHRMSAVPSTERFEIASPRWGSQNVPAARRSRSGPDAAVRRLSSIWRVGVCGASERASANRTCPSFALAWY